MARHRANTSSGSEKACYACGAKGVELKTPPDGGQPICKSCQDFANRLRRQANAAPETTVEIAPPTREIPNNGQS